MSAASASPDLRTTSTPGRRADPRVRGLVGVLWCVLVLGSAGSPDPARAQAPLSAPPAIADRLTSRGFEGVRVAVAHDRLVLRYENRVYRYDIHAILAIASELKGMSDVAAEAILIPEYRGVPLLYLSLAIPAVSAEDVDWEHAVHDYRATRASLDHPDEVPGTWTKRTSSSSWKVDVIVHPQMSAQFGSFSDPVRTQINLAPEIETSLWTGMRASAQVIIPLQNDFGEEEDEVRPGVVALHQLLRTPQNTFLGLSIGYFSLDRYGIDVESRTYFYGGRLAFGGRLGFTGFARYTNRTWYYDDLERWTPTATVSYRWPRYTMQIDLTGGRFAFGDEGIRADITRRFGEVHVRLFGLMAGGEENIGFGIRLPIPIHRHLRPARVRFRTADAVEWEYEYRGLPEAGRQYRTGGEIRSLWYDLDPVFLPRLLAGATSRSRVSR